MTSPSPNEGSTPQLPDYVPVPESAFGPALNEQGYFVGRVERNLFWVTDGTRAQPLAGQHLHPLPGPRRAHAHRHRQLQLGAHLQPQPQRGRARLHRRPGTGHDLPVEALHRRSSRPAGHPRRPGPAPAVHRRHRGQRARRARHGRPDPYFSKYGANAWAGVDGYLDAVTARAAAPIIAKYTGVLAAADVPAFTTSTTFTILQSIRLDLGTGSQVHP